VANKGDIMSFEDCSDAELCLSKEFFKITEFGVISPINPEHVITLKEEEAIDYLCYEWDFMWTYSFEPKWEAYEKDPFNSDSEADADALKSVGFGTDEDYGDHGEDRL
jgi:hypothetical protein